MGQRLRVLVAEDEFIIGCDLCHTVEEAGYIVEGPFEDLSSTMLAFQKNKPDIAILDVQLEDGIRDVERSRGLGDVYKRHVPSLVSSCSTQVKEYHTNRFVPNFRRACQNVRRTLLHLRQIDI